MTTADRRGAPRHKPTLAFSMLELVVALAVVAVVAVYAMPMYREHIARGHRRTAIAALYRAAHFLEGGGYDSLRPRSTELPVGLAQAPDAGAAVYRLQVLPADASNGGYAIEAHPLEASPMSNDPCGTFVMDAVGRRTNRAAGGRALLRADCWLAR